MKKNYKGLLTLILISLLQISSALSADNIAVSINGKSYQCSGSGDAPECWSECNRHFQGASSFDYCARQCGGGASCWDTCKQYFSGASNFEYCRKSCGQSRAPQQLPTETHP